MIDTSEGEWRMEREKMSNGLFLGWRVIQTVYMTDGTECECQIGDGLDEETARTILQRFNG